MSSLFSLDSSEPRREACTRLGFPKPCINARSCSDAKALTEATKTKGVESIETIVTEISGIMNSKISKRKKIPIAKIPLDKVSLDRTSESKTPESDASKAFMKDKKPMKTKEPRKEISTEKSTAVVKLKMSPYDRLTKLETVMSGGQSTRLQVTQRVAKLVSESHIHKDLKDHILNSERKATDLIYVIRLTPLYETRVSIPYEIKIPEGVTSILAREDMIQNPNRVCNLIKIGITSSPFSRLNSHLLHYGSMYHLEILEVQNLPGWNQVVETTLLEIMRASRSTKIGLGTCISQSSMNHEVHVYDEVVMETDTYDSACVINDLEIAKVMVGFYACINPKEQETRRLEIERDQKAIEREIRMLDFIKTQQDQAFDFRLENLETQMTLDRDRIVMEYEYGIRLADLERDKDLFKATYDFRETKVVSC